jgi:hypothetical protein
MSAPTIAATITPEMVREALAHVPFKLVGAERFDWLATYFNNAIQAPDTMCPCCNVTPNGDVLDHLPIEQPAPSAAPGAMDSLTEAALDVAMNRSHENPDEFSRSLDRLEAALAQTKPEGMVWRSIHSMPSNDSMVIAKCDDGRVMVYRASILARNLQGPTPNHLQFPATKWMPIPSDAAIPAGAGDARNG